MRRILASFLISLFISHILTAGTLTENEVKEIKADIALMMTSFEQGDAQALLDKTHESVYALVGGNKESFDKMMRQAAQQIMDMGIKFRESELGTPTETYLAGKYELCFVPRVSVMEMQGQKIKSTGFMLAARTVGEPGWKYLDGAGFSKNPALLKTLFPGIDPKVKLPPSRMERL